MNRRQSVLVCKVSEVCIQHNRHNRIGIGVHGLMEILLYSLSTSLSMAFEHLTSSMNEFSCCCCCCCCGTAFDAAMVMLMLNLSDSLSGLPLADVY